MQQNGTLAGGLVPPLDARSVGEIRSEREEISDQRR